MVVIRCEFGPESSSSAPNVIHAIAALDIDVLVLTEIGQGAAPERSKEARYLDKAGRHLLADQANGSIPLSDHALFSSRIPRFS